MKISCREIINGKFIKSACIEKQGLQGSIHDVRVWYLLTINNELKLRKKYFSKLGKERGDLKSYLWKIRDEDVEFTFEDT